MIDDASKYQIRQKVTHLELYGQLAEECCELAQAALKMQRWHTENNPPRKSFLDCAESLDEEIADVVLLLNLLDIKVEAPFRYRSTIDRKAERWIRESR